MYVERGIHRVDELMEKTGFSETQVRRILNQTGAKKEYRRRIEKAKRLFHELQIDDLDMLSSLAGLHPDIIAVELHKPIVRGGSQIWGSHPPLRTAGEILRESAAHMLADAARNGLSEDNIKSWMTLANAFEKFRTGDFRLEMVVSGIEDFAAYLKDHAKEANMTEAHIFLLVRFLNQYTKEKVEQLRMQIESTPEI